MKPTLAPGTKETGPEPEAATPKDVPVASGSSAMRMMQHLLTSNGNLSGVDGPRSYPTPQSSSQHPALTRDTSTIGSGMDEVRKVLERYEKESLGAGAANALEKDDRKLIPRMIRLLGLPHLDAAHKIEALWSLSVLPTDHTVVLLLAGAVPVLLQLFTMHGDRQDLIEYVLLVLGNMAGDSPKARTAIADAKAWPHLLKAVKQGLDGGAESVSLLRISVWTLSHVCDGPCGGTSGFAQVATQTFALLCQVLQRCEDTEVLSHACWTLSYLCDSTNSHVQKAVDQKVVEELVLKLSHRNWRVVKPALRAVGNVVCAEEGDKDFTQYVCDCDAVACLRKLTRHSNREIQKEACWTLSNIAAGSVGQIQKVISSGALTDLVELALNESSDPDVRTEACWVVLNATSCGSSYQIASLVDFGCANVLSELLGRTEVETTPVVSGKQQQHHHHHHPPAQPAAAAPTSAGSGFPPAPAMVAMALEGLEKILSVGETLARALGDVNGGEAPNPYLQHVNAASILRLRAHAKASIAKRAAAVAAEHYVVCAICHSWLPKRGGGARFCSECAVHVCSECDCTQFHLSYQDNLWKELEADEKSEAAASLQQKAAASSSKSQKRKASKQRKKLAAATAASTPSTAATGKSKSEEGGEDSEDGGEDEPKDYVEFLLRKGSILELAKRMEREEMEEAAAGRKAEVV